MPIPLGILAVAGAGGAAGAYDLLETTVLSSSVSSVTFSNLGNYSTYKHLQIRIAGRADRTNFRGDEILVRFNSSTSTYRSHQLGGDGSSVYSSDYSGETGLRAGITTSNLDSTSQFGAAVIDILDFGSTSKNKTVRGLSGRAGTTSSLALFSGLWVSTNAVTTLALLPANSSNFVAGSRFSLYGVK
jgi:hypothetical protein